MFSILAEMVALRTVNAYFQLVERRFTQMDRPDPNPGAPAEPEEQDTKPLVPNATTVAAMEESDDKAVSFSDIAALMADLNADD
jgi:hypothetical protein